MADPEFAEIEKASHIYRSFMEEIKTRLNVIAETVALLKANPNDPHGFLHAEFGFLQLRFVCDLIALSVLAAHKPYGLTDILLESWHARRALNDLKTINPVSFPRPCKITGADGHKHIDWKDDGVLKREGLQRIYDKCGKLLHRGIIKHMFEGQRKAYDIGALNRWAARIGELLSTHALIYPEKGLALIVYLAGGSNGSVQIAIAQADGPAVFVQPEAKQHPASKPSPPRAGKHSSKGRGSKNK